MTAERAENVVQVIIMLAIGTMAGAASFTHVHDVTVAHGQPNWIGWANAVVVELMSIALGLELRRRARTGRPTSFVITALLFFVVVSLAAQVVEAERSIIGWLAAALPAIGFIVLVKVVLSRTAAVATNTATHGKHTEQAPHAGTAVAGDPAVDEQHGPADPATATVVDHVDETTSTQPQMARGTEPDTSEPGAPEQAAPAPVVPTHLLPTARFAVVNHRQTTGRTITADELAVRMSITPTTAGQLLHAVNAPERINGTPVGGAR